MVKALEKMDLKPKLVEPNMYATNAHQHGHHHGNYEDRIATLQWRLAQERSKNKRLQWRCQQQEQVARGGCCCCCFSCCVQSAMFSVMQVFNWHSVSFSQFEPLQLVGLTCLQTLSAAEALSSSSTCCPCPCPYLHPCPCPAAWSPKLGLLSRCSLVQTGSEWLLVFVKLKLCHHPMGEKACHHLNGEKAYLFGEVWLCGGPLFPAWLSGARLIWMRSVSKITLCQLCNSEQAHPGLTLEFATLRWLKAEGLTPGWPWLGWLKASVQSWTGRGFKPHTAFAPVLGLAGGGRLGGRGSLPGMPRQLPCPSRVMPLPGCLAFRTSPVNFRLGGFSYREATCGAIGQAAYPPSPLPLGACRGVGAAKLGPRHTPLSARAPLSCASAVGGLCRATPFPAR